MNGHEVPGFDQVDEQPLFILAGVARDVHRSDLLVHHVGPLLEKAIDGATDHLLVARDSVGRDDDRVATNDPDLTVPAKGHAGQSRRGLALRTSA